jgi:hypothetical protein
MVRFYKLERKEYIFIEVKYSLWSIIALAIRLAHRKCLLFLSNFAAHQINVLSLDPGDVLVILKWATMSLLRQSIGLRLDPGAVF